MRTITTEDIAQGMTVATIPSVASGSRTRIVGTVVSIDRYEIMGQNFADVKLDTDLGPLTTTVMSGQYELITEGN